MKKQIIIVSALAAGLLSSSLFAADITATLDAVNTVTSAQSRSNQLLGNDDLFVTDAYNFNLSAGVTLKFVQNATAIGAAAATKKGSNAIFGGSTQGGISECAGTSTTATPGDPTAASGCAGSGSGGS